MNPQEKGQTNNPGASADIIHPKTLHVVGPKKSGKTRLLEFLIGELTQRGYRVGALKHSSHHHLADKPGSDSDRLQRAGAHPTLFFTPGGLAVFGEAFSLERLNEWLMTIFRQCDLVLVESLRESPHPKIALGGMSTDSQKVENIIAGVDQTGTGMDYPVFRHNDPALVDFLLTKLHLTP